MYYGVYCGWKRKVMDLAFGHYFQDVLVCLLSLKRKHHGVGSLDSSDSAVLHRMLWLEEKEEVVITWE